MSLPRIGAASSAALCSIILASGVLAQNAEHPEHLVEGTLSKAEFEEQKQNLRERNRSAMHPGDPLLLVGVEQGDNDIRSRTPALLNSDRNTTKVSEDEAYQRRLALYDGGGHKLQPLTIERSHKPEKQVAPANQAPEQPAPPSKKRPLLALCVGVLASTVFCAWAFKRYAHLFMRPAA